MSEHKLPAGKRLIKGLSALGTALEYHVEREFPVLEGHRGQNPAVDVAWFGDKAQRFPLMIFEVESGAGNTIANNPLKVFAQDSQEFEKPLFYFQLIAEGDSNSARIDLLTRQYGTHNYRLYRIGRDEGTSFLKDVVRQHRRIRDRIDYVAVYETLTQPEWRGVADAIVVLDEAYSIGLSKENRLAAFVRLGCTYSAVHDQLPKFIHEDRGDDWQSVRSMPTYLAATWGPPILCAWMVGRCTDELGAIEWDRHFFSWQNDWVGYLPMFSPEIALSSEYADFMSSLGGPFAACLAGLSRCRTGISSEVLRVLMEVLRRIGPDDYGLQVAAWACHISARLNNSDAYEQAQSYIEDAGGLAFDDLIHPPSSYSLEGDGRAEYFPGDKSPRISINEFRRCAQEAYKDVEIDLGYMAFSALDNDSFCLEWAESILPSLWSDS